ncbi:hypothetical protein [Alicyclobacillus dauci]|uniref:Uncharacterized protein n=1 Tax=Alicyclobacillus dauci TaxID=1475485 RepID=A0ABY6YWW7_9BACL|nr:hypothetical protein [Alicyclobacillus dauci]WAH35029.1 hypothetical protein NZD86_11885 [Alicyclobacillus dauci]
MTTDGRVLSNDLIREIEQTHGHEWRIANLIATIHDLQRQVSELTEWVEDMQWCASASWYESDHCPYCESSKDKGHKSDCELGNFLAKHAPRQEDET